jgi:hypothetical protein
MTENKPWQIRDEWQETALIRLLTYLENPKDGESKAVLLFGSVEILPKEVQPPPNIEWQHSGVVEDKLRSRLFYTVFRVPADMGVDWYRVCREEQKWTQPTEDFELNNAICPAHELRPLLQEPTWPLLALNNKESEFPFIPPIWVGVFTHHLMTEQTEPPWKHPSHTAEEFASQMLGFSFREYPEFLGSVHLLVPNPLLRNVRQSAIGEVGIDPRAGITLPKLNLTVIEETQAGIVKCTAGEGEPGQNNFATGDENHQHGFILSCADGILHYEKPVGSVRSVVIDLGLVSNTHVSVTGKKRTEEYLAPSVLHSKVQVGEPANPGASRLLARGQDHRKTVREHKDSQFWFDGNSEDAKDLVRRLASHAHNRVVLVDTYFDGYAAALFCPAVNNKGVIAQILSSEFYLLKKESSASETKNLVVLNKVVADLHLKKIDNFEIRMLPGKNESPIHDRFLVVDNDVWLLGSSFKDFGKRGTMLVKLRNPQPIIRQLTSHWENSLSLGDPDGET